ncbi:MAG: protein kinase [Planctomycetales bacterium]|nr:protein kinase [Planctomycetales bacterium]
MTGKTPPTIRFQGREERVLDTLHVRGHRYEILELLSHRGAFRVFDRHAGVEGNYRALYRIPAERMTRQRAEVLRRLGGPSENRHFPLTIECSRVGQEWILVTEWVAGTNLRAYLEQLRANTIPRSSIREVVRLLRGLAHGLHHYHRRTNLVHGDVSPANLVITQGTTQLVLVDFGSAWTLESDSQREAGDGMTRPYAAPERLAGHALADFRADQFSLGVIGYEWLTLQIPYAGCGGQAGTPYLINSLGSTYVAPSTLMAGSDRVTRSAVSQLDALLARCLSLQPDQRFPTSRAHLAAWDSLWRELQPGSRLSPWQRTLVEWLSRLRFWRRA